ncbi:bifunctional diaminohydroxyphosphoribosylaminopyrimidine deaminase/5-amino-6-(5-phosphoribosylamino)uracil reductase RibD [Devosia rhodophyticola]|uniref:Riboflavin biosynthesis protein RibD n=1 Tax=Devosia rhodophyticola TaxID=3026423 RepID=A0ABY7YYB8_9HYPH|nr:bifunctional diaminohydroxyphosphoribosylaminopyrimidine deaminase/5-amino-6-(5-phosphoribosylamino)uracil reductase RibD [Devosia rhodophyticola]WDR06088.1 bifunctional diaminohydroxyphosphoribosylaminopyrimidine deaminase/5-amino-6-(5-phosphoribosylamino)uracil reductase RibD [Devosia rhodophyticola]
MNQSSAEDLRWLDAAVRYATPFRGTTAENPVVAAFIVDPDQKTLLSRAITAPGGRPHAEPQALEAAGELARGKTLYVTLEPCDHWGRTPPCVDAIIRAGVARVVIGTGDPDSRTSGKSAQRLADAGIEVIQANHAPSRSLHEGHVKRQLRGQPFVTAKLAVSADGRIGLPDWGNLAITGEPARQWTHMQRAFADAVLIGAATAKADDPKLTVRIKGLERRTPLRLVLVGAGGLDPKLNLIASFTGYRVAIIATPEADITVPASISVIRVPGENGRPNLGGALSALSKMGIVHLLVEGGAKLTEALLDEHLVDRFELLTSTIKVGKSGIRATDAQDMEKRLVAAGMSEVDVHSLGEDMLHTFEKRAKD